MLEGEHASWFGRLSWRHALALGAVPLIAAVAYLGWQYSSSRTDEGAVEAIGAQGGRPAPPADTTARRYLMVFVSGAVARPGLYRLESGLRVSDAIAAAGGILADADPDKLPNLAAKLSDGKQIKIARRTASSRASTTIRVDINHASLDELMTVPGMDLELANQIIDYRDSFGGFLTVSELQTQLGLDAAWLSRLRRYLVAGD